MDIIYIIVCISISYWLGYLIGKYDYKRKIKGVIRNLRHFNVINGLDALEGYINTNEHRQKVNI